MSGPEVNVQFQIDAIPDAVLVIDDAGARVNLNAAARALLGYERDAMPESDAADMFPVWPPVISRNWRAGTARRHDGTFIVVTMAVTALPELPGTGSGFMIWLRAAEAAAFNDAALARFAAIVSSSPLPIIGATLDGTIISWNPAAEQLYGYSTVMAVGEPLNMLQRPDLAGDLATVLDQVRQGDSIRDFETVQRTRAGDLLTILIAAAPVREVDGSVVAVSIIARDSTEMQEANQALRLWERVIASATNGIAIADATLPDNPIVNVNPAFTRMTGYESADCIGRNCRFLQGADTDPDEVSRIREAIATGQDFTGTLLNYRKDGTPFWNELHIAAVRDERNNLTHFVGVQTDVTQRIHAEARHAQERDLLNAVMESLPDSIYIKDTSSRFMLVNRAGARELGAANPADLIGKTDFDIFPKALAEQFLADEQRLFATGTPIRNQPQRHSETEADYWVLASKVLVRTTRGEVVGLVGSNRDVTEQRRLQQERDKLHAELAAEIERAAEVQARLLPQAPPDAPGYVFVGVCLPTRQVGGDFFDWHGDGRAVRISLGDVMGKGMSAALLTATVRAALRTVANLPVSAAVEAVNRAISPDLARSDGFVTLFHAMLEPQSGMLTYVDAGHGMVFVQRRDGRVEPLRQRAVPLGVLPDAVYPAEATTLHPGDTLVVYSDGLPDARPDLRLDPDGVAHQFAGLAGARAKLEHLVELVTQIETRPDDLTLVLVFRGNEA